MSQYVFGVDIGGTTVKLGYFDAEGNVLDKWEIPTRKEDNGSHILPDIAASIEKKIRDAGIDRKDVAGVGVGAPGPVDSEGVIYKTANLGWGVFSIKETLENILKLPVMAGNDANVAALGEAWKGAAAGSDNVIMVTLGTGVGGGIIVDGKIVAGTHGAGGEIGHVLVVRGEAEKCNCGNHGCLEQYASAIPGNVIDLSEIFPYTKSYFTYDAASGQYLKNIHGAAQVDGMNGEQLTFSNVIIQNTNWSKRDAKGYLAFQTIDSTSDGYYFTKGRGIHITWKKTSDYSPTKYYDDNGNEIQINQGKTYIAIAQKDRTLLYS